jgi:sugar lactone lactonase YvrE
MAFHSHGGVKTFAMGASIALAALVAGCGGGGGGGDGPPISQPPVDTSLPLMLDSAGRQVPEAEFGRGDALAAGADGIAFDDAPLADAPVTLADNAGNTRTANTNASGYYRVDIKGLRPPFLVKVKRKSGGELFSAGTAAAVTRGFVAINVNGLTDKALGYVADALNAGGGAASAVTGQVLSSNVALLDPAKAKLRAGLAIPLANAGLDAASYDPVTVSLVQASAVKHASLLSALHFRRNTAGRATVIGTIAGNPRTLGVAGVAVDAAGNMFVADTLAHSIRKISPAGEMTTLAGSGTLGFADGVGAAATFDQPHGLTLDADGNLFVADTSNNAIRKITPAGVVSTVAGAPERGFVDGNTSVARFYHPSSVALDRSGNVYVADGNYALRKITPDGKVSTIAGYTPQSPYPQFGNPTTWPSSPVVDGTGNVYYTDVMQGRIVKLTADGAASDWYRKAEVGPGKYWFSIALGTAGDIYAAGLNEISRITAAGQVQVVAGKDLGSADGPGLSARFGHIAQIVVTADGSLIVADLGNRSIRKMSAGGQVTTVAGNTANGFADGPATSAWFSGPWSGYFTGFSFGGIGGLAVDAGGNIYLADTGNHAIRKISRTGIVTTVAGSGLPGAVDGNGRAASFNAPNGLALDTSGNIYVADTNNAAIRKITPQGDVTTLAGSTFGFANGAGSAAKFNRPYYVAVAADGVLYVSDNLNRAVRRITPGGVVSTLAQGGPEAFTGLADFSGVGAIVVDPQGSVLVKAARTYDVLAISGDGGTTRVTNTPFPAVSSARDSLGVDSSGNLYYLNYEAVGTGSRLIRRSKAGVETELVNDIGQLLFYDQGSQLTVDSNGNVIIGDPKNVAVRIVLP